MNKSNKTRQYRPCPGNGSIQPGRPFRPRIVVQFDEDTFNEIRKLALENRSSMGEQIRLLCEIGLEEIGGAE